MSIRVKICGLRRTEDVDGCVAAGVDALGFNFYPKSPRYISPLEAMPLIARVPSKVMTVGVFVGVTPAEVATIVSQTGIRSIQLHGEEEPEPFTHLGTERIQVVRVRPGQKLPRPSRSADWLLLDAWVEKYGGEGQRFDWQQAALELDKPVMVAGGVTPENVRHLLDTARPAGIDVASGVESKPGIKDVARVRALVEAVRTFERSE